MEGKTSTSNEGSKISRKTNSTINHNGRTFTEAKSENVSDKKMEKILNSNGFKTYDLNFLSVSFIDNMKTIGGDEYEISDIDSYATMEFNPEEIQVNFVPLQLKSLTEKNKEKSDRRREKEKAKRAKAREEREAREAEEIEANKRRKEIEKTDNPEARRNRIQMTKNEIEDDKDAI